MNILDLTGLTQSPPAGRKTATGPASAAEEGEASSFSQAIAAVPRDDQDTTAGDAEGEAGTGFRFLSAPVTVPDGGLTGAAETEAGLTDAAASDAVAGAAQAASAFASKSDGKGATVVAPDAAQPVRIAVADTSPRAAANAANDREPGRASGDASRTVPSAPAGRAAEVSPQALAPAGSAHTASDGAPPHSRPAIAAAAMDGRPTTTPALPLQAEPRTQLGAGNVPPGGAGEPAPGISQALENASRIAQPKIEAAQAAPAASMQEAATAPKVGDAPEAEPAATRLAAAEPQADRTAPRAGPATHTAFMTGPDAATPPTPQASLPVQQTGPAVGTSAPAMPAERAVLHQITAAIVPGTTPGKIDVTLDPPELGRIEIVIDLSDQTLKATLSADRHGTADLIRRHLDQLGAEFRQAGFADVDLTYAGNRDGNARQFDRGGADMPVPETPVAAEPVRQVVRPAVATSRIDIRL